MNLNLLNHILVVCFYIIMNNSLPHLLASLKENSFATVSLPISLTILKSGNKDIYMITSSVSGC